MYGRAKCMQSAKAHRIGRTAASERTSQPDAPVGQGGGEIVGAHRFLLGAGRRPADAGLSRKL